MYAEVAWVLVSSETQVQPKIIPDLDYLPDYLSVSYDYVLIQAKMDSEATNKTLNLVHGVLYKVAYTLTTPAAFSCRFREVCVTF